MKKSKGFSLVELLIVIVIIGVLSAVSFVAIQRAKSRAINEKMMDDLVAIANSLEDFRRDNQTFPVPDPGSNQNILCYYADATYAHSCDPDDGAVFRQGMIDNALLSKRYLREVPTDPRTGSRYVYGVTNDGKFFQVAGIYESEEGIFEARTAGNLAKGFELPSVIRAFNSADFVVNKGTYLPYSPDYLVLSAKLDNINGTVSVDGKSLDETLYEDDEITTGVDGSVDIYFSDGSVTHLDKSSTLKLKNMEVDRNDAEGTVTKILLKIKAGKIWSKVVRLGEKSEFRVETTGAIAGVRGTEFSVDANDNVEVLAGEVWQVTGKTDETVEDPEIENPANEVAPVAVVSEYISPSDEYYDEYIAIPLHSGIQPHILSVKAGVITVRNVNHFTNIVDDLIGFDRRIKASHLAAYNANDLLNKIEEVDITGDVDTPHVLTVTDFTHPIVLRFEDHETGRVSGFSSVELQVSAQTDLGEADLYPNLFLAGKPALEVIVPPVVSLEENPTFEAIIETINYTGPDLMYTITTQGPCSSAGPSESPVIVAVGGEGLCALAFSATLESGEVLNAEAEAQIIAGTQKLFLEYPEEGAVLPVTEVAPRWRAQNASNPEFVLTFDGADYPNAVSGGTNIIGLTPGIHEWSVTMTEEDNTTETKTATFTITEEATAYFTVDAEDAFGNTVPIANDALTTATPQVKLKFQASPIPADFTYNWVSGTLDVQPPASQNPTATADLPEDMPTQYNVTLDVLLADGTVASSMDKIITATYQPIVCGDGVAEGNEVCDVSDFKGLTCDDYTGVGSTGTLSCIENCTLIDPSACIPPGPTLEQVCIDAGGYFDGSACWLLGEPGTGANCVDTCAILPNPANGFCVSIDWNDDVNCSICDQFNETDMQSCASSTSTSAPFYTTTQLKCNYRTTGNVDCSSTVPSTIRRICKCE